MVVRAWREGAFGGYIKYLIFSPPGKPGCKINDHHITIGNINIAFVIYFTIFRARARGNLSSHTQDSDLGQPVQSYPGQCLGQPVQSYQDSDLGQPVQSYSGQGLGATCPVIPRTVPWGNLSSHTQDSDLGQLVQSYPGQ